MAEPVSLQTLLTYLTLISVPVGVFYHIMTLRNTRKNQELQLETRRVQLFQNLLDKLESPENLIHRMDLLKMEWEDYDDFERKWGSDNNPDAWAKRNFQWYRFNGLGMLVRDGNLDADMVYDYLGIAIIWSWAKWESIILEQRVRYKIPQSELWFEFLAGEMKRIHEERGYTFEVPENFLRYDPEPKT